jgi:hypothetical protein
MRINLALILFCVLRVQAQTAGANVSTVPSSVVITSKMDWSRGSSGSHYGANFIQLREPCQREGLSCECVMSFKIISSAENAKEFADYITSFEHGKVPVTYEVWYGQDAVVHEARLVSVGDWKRDRFRTNDTLLGVELKFSTGGPQKQVVHSPGDCFPSRIP